LRDNRTVLGFLLLVEIVAIVLCLNFSSRLPSYDPYSFFDDFGASVIDQSRWELIGTSRFDLRNSVLTLDVPLNESAALKHDFVKWSVARESQAGSVTVKLRLQQLGYNSSRLRMVNLDGGWMGVLDLQFVYYDDKAPQVHILQQPLDSEWHIFNIRYSDDSRNVFWDGKENSVIKNVGRYTYVILGNAEPENDEGGALSVDWVNVTSAHTYTPP
jgi:hypothetical protein